MHEERLDPEQAQAVIREAVRLQQEQEGKIDPQTLEASAAEIGVDPKYLREALQRIEQEQARRARRRRGFLIALGVGVALCVLNLFYSQQVLSPAWAEVNLRRAQLQNVLERRASLLPRLENLVSQASQQQREKLQPLIDALRVQPERAASLTEQLLSDPALRNDWLFVRLMDEVAGSENRVAVERRRFEEAATRYEQLARRFPVSLARPLLGYPARVERPY